MEVNFICPNWSIIGLVRLTKPSNYLTRVNICLQNFDKFPLNHCDQKSRISLGNSAITQRCVLPVSFPVDLLKVRKFQKENMELSHCPKYERKISNSALNTCGRIFQIFSFIFWAIRRLYIFILKFIDLYYGSNDFTGKETGKKHLCDISENAQYRSNFFSDVTDMVPFIIWAPAFFGPQKIWFPRMLVPAWKCHIMSFMRVLNFLGPRFL